MPLKYQYKTLGAFFRVYQLHYCSWRSGKGENHKQNQQCCHYNHADSLYHLAAFLCRLTLAVLFYLRGALVFLGILFHI